jgi:glycosyltransferase involved in cell wall biosynthesis
MKIVSVMTTTSDGGAEFAAISLLDALAARGHETVMLTDKRGIVRDSRVREAPLELGPKLSRRTWPGLGAKSPLLLARLRRALRAEAPYDVLLLHFKKEQLLAAALPRDLRARTAWAEWGPVPFPLRRGLPNRAYRRAARDVHAVLAISAGTRESVIAAGVAAERVHVVPNVVSGDEIAPDREAGARLRHELGIPSGAFAVGCVSRFHPKKRNDVAIDAALLLRADEGGRESSSVHLLLAGDGETEAELRERARPLGDAAHFLPTPGPRIAQVLSAFDVSVFCPSPTEGAPRAVIAAMLTELPCVATGAEGVADLLAPGTGVIASPENDPAAVAEALRAFRDDPELRRSTGAAARRHALALHDADTIARRLEQLLG